MIAYYLCCFLRIRILIQNSAEQELLLFNLRFDCNLAISELEEIAQWWICLLQKRADYFWKKCSSNFAIWLSVTFVLDVICSWTVNKIECNIVEKFSTECLILEMSNFLELDFIPTRNLVVPARWSISFAWLHISAIFLCLDLTVPIFYLLGYSFFQKLQ